MIRVLSASDVRQALPMDVAVAAMKQAFAGLSNGDADVPDRVHMDVAPFDGVTLVMPAFVHDKQGSSMAVKVVSLFDQNTAHGIPRIQAAVLALEAETGRPVAIAEGAALTAIRTGAASGAATDLLARQDSRVCAILGAGVQARTQLEAVCTVRKIETVWVYDPVAEAVDALIEDMRSHGPIPADIRSTKSSAEAVSQADVVCAATVASQPAFDDADIKPGTHINAIGSYQPHVVELPVETVLRSLLVVDNREAALSETGDLIQPIEKGLMTADHIHADLGEVVLGRKTSRTDPEQITLFKSVGIAVQDAVAVRTTLDRAKKMGLGQVVAWME